MGNNSQKQIRKTINNKQCKNNKEKQNTQSIQSEIDTISLVPKSRGLADLGPLTLTSKRKAAENMHAMETRCDSTVIPERPTDVSHGG